MTNETTTVENHPGAPPPNNLDTNLFPPGFFPAEWIKRDVEAFKVLEKANFDTMRACQEGIIKLQKLCLHDYEEIGDTHTKTVSVCKICQYQKSE